jgi:antitoxin component YwqK of YwqJK toxin-antitoxin module
MTTVYTPQFLDTLKKKPQEAQTSTPRAEEPHHDRIQEVKNPDGRLIMKVPYKGDKINGTYEAYHPETGQLMQTIQYVEGVMEGMMTAYDGQKQMTHQIPYVAGKKEGLAHFFINGSKVSEIPYKDDQMDGAATFFAPGGSIRAIIGYKNNMMDGDFTAYDPAHKVLKKCGYIQGKQDGPCKQFYPSGKVFEESVYKEGLLQGEVKKYQENGTPLEIATYNDQGQMVSQEKFDMKGQSLGKQEVGQSHG